MSNREILEAVQTIEREKGISSDELLGALEEALLAAYKKTPDATPFARVEVDRDSGVFRLYQFVGDDLPEDALILVEDFDEMDPDAELPPEGEEDEEDIQFDIDWSKVPDSLVEVSEVTPEGSFGRIAAQTARQVILQRIRDAERGMMYEEYIDRVGELITGIVQQSDRRITLIDLGSAEAILPRSESIPGERYDHGSRIRAVIAEVRDAGRGPQIVLSRGSDDFIRALFELEVPEVGDGLVTIRAVAREAGFRTKIAVESDQPGVDPVGACVGPRGSRVRMVVSELRGEKIDIIPYNDEPARYIAKALSPARVREVVVDDEERQATVIVPDDQLALAIGREGQNARLAARLTGWRIDIRGASEYSGDEGVKVDEPGQAQQARQVLEDQKRSSGPVEVNLYRSLPPRREDEGAVEAPVEEAATEETGVEAHDPASEAGEPIDTAQDASVDPAPASDIDVPPGDEDADKADAEDEYAATSGPADGDDEVAAATAEVEDEDADQAGEGEPESADMPHSSVE